MMEGLSFNSYRLRDQVLYHVYTEKFSPLFSTGHGQPTNSWFNNSGLGVRRFDPVYDVQGRIIPSFYAAFTDLVALGESIIRQPSSLTNGTANNREHDEHITSTNLVNTLTWRPETPLQQQQGLTKGIAQFIPNRELTLIDLETVQTPDGNRPLQTWLKQGEQTFPALHVVSNWFAQRFLDHDGLTWNGMNLGRLNRGGSQSSISGERGLMLFGDRVTSSDLRLLSHQPLNSAPCLDQIRNVVRPLNVIPPEWLIR